MRNRAGVVAASIALAYAGGSLALASTGASLRASLDRTAVVDATVGLAAAAGAWLVLTWLTSAALVAVVAHVSPAARARAAVLPGVLVPVLVRRTVAVLLGVGLAATPGAAGAAVAAPVASVATADRAGSVTPPSWEVLGGDRLGGDRLGGDRLGGDRLDRPGVDLSGWTPDRPARPIVRRPSPVQLVTAAPRPEAAVDEDVVVRRGDTLWDLVSRRLGPSAGAEAIAAEWPRWHEANRAVIGPDPHLLVPGQVLTPPDPAPGTPGRPRTATHSEEHQ